MPEVGSAVAVLHVVPPNGGGVDRYVRGICAARPQDWLVHVSDQQWVAEHPAESIVVPIRPDQDSITALGAHRLVHAHSTLAETRGAVHQLTQGTKGRYVLTLHDIAFADRSGAVTKEEGTARADFVRQAADLIAPSNYIADSARQLLNAPLPRLTVVPNGVTRDSANASGAGHPANAPIGFDVAVIGALGAHKGLHRLDEVASCLPAGIRILVAGYVDGQTEPGWRIPERLWIHGPFEPSDLKGLVACHSVKVAFFPNRMPESFCYALSDAWLAGLPALVPDHGALGERMAQWQAGWAYPPDSPPAELARLLVEALASAGEFADRVATAAKNQPTEDQMVGLLENIYSTHLPESVPVDPLPTVARQAQTHLNGVFFRQELVRLTAERAELLEQQARLHAELTELSRGQAERAMWIERQHADIESLQQEVVRVESARAVENRELQAAIEGLRAGTEALQREKAALAEQLAHLQHEHRESEALLSALLIPLRILPDNFRDRLIRSAKWRLAKRKQK